MLGKIPVPLLQQKSKFYKIGYFRRNRKIDCISDSNISAKPKKLYLTRLQHVKRGASWVCSAKNLEAHCPFDETYPNSPSEFESELEQTKRDSGPQYWHLPISTVSAIKNARAKKRLAVLCRFMKQLLLDKIKQFLFLEKNWKKAFYYNKNCGKD